MTFIILAIIAYLIGSIPSSVWISKIFYKKDIRNLGSGNAGATNMYRNFGILPAISVLILDALKGFIAISLSTDIDYQIVLGFSVLLGHVFPIFANFRGGKGVSTFAGCVLGLNPILIVVPFFVYIILLFTFRISSVASIFSAFTVLLSAMAIQIDMERYTFLLLSIIFLCITHRKNLQRLLSGGEQKLF